MIPIEEKEKDQGPNVLFGHISLRVKNKEDEDTEGCSDEVESKVPENGRGPVGCRVDSAHKVKMFHLANERGLFSIHQDHLWYSLLNVENYKGSRDEAECEDDADSVGEADANLTAVGRKLA